MGEEVKLDKSSYISDTALKSLAATIAAIGVILGSAFTVDTRYAHSEEMKVTAIRQQQQITELHSSFLDDKIFELEIRKANTPKTWTATDQLMLDRYKSKLNGLGEIKIQQSNMLKEISKDTKK